MPPRPEPGRAAERAPQASQRRRRLAPAARLRRAARDFALFRTSNCWGGVILCSRGHWEVPAQDALGRASWLWGVCPL